MVPPYDNDNDPLPRSRSEALANGSIRYFTGKPCVYGHISPRYTKSYVCIACSSLHLVKYKTENPGYFRNHKAEKRDLNPGVHAQRAREYRERNGDKVREREREYYRNNPLAKIVKDQNRRAKKGRGGQHSQAELSEILHIQSFSCNVCSADISSRDKRHLDHIVPLSRGGSNLKSNLQFLCASCNLSKGAKSMDEFLEYRRRISPDSSE